MRKGDDSAIPMVKQGASVRAQALEASVRRTQAPMVEGSSAASRVSKTLQQVGAHLVASATTTTTTTPTQPPRPRTHSGAALAACSVLRTNLQLAGCLALLLRLRALVGLEVLPREPADFSVISKILSHRPTLLVARLRLRLAAVCLVLNRTISKQATHSADPALTAGYLAHKTLSSSLSRLSVDLGSPRIPGGHLATAQVPAAACLAPRTINSKRKATHSVETPLVLEVVSLATRTSQLAIRSSVHRPQIPTLAVGCSAANLKPTPAQACSVGRTKPRRLGLDCLAAAQTQVPLVAASLATMLVNRTLQARVCLVAAPMLGARYLAATTNPSRPLRVCLVILEQLTLVARCLEAINRIKTRTQAVLCSVVVSRISKTMDPRFSVV